MLRSYAKKIVKTAVHAIIVHDMEEWPPSCFGLLYQPMRPYRIKEKETPMFQINAYENNSSGT